MKWARVYCAACRLGINVGQRVVHLPVGIADVNAAGGFVVQGTIEDPVVVHLDCISEINRDLNVVRSED